MKERPSIMGQAYHRMMKAAVAKTNADEIKQLRSIIHACPKCRKRFLERTKYDEGS